MLAKQLGACLLTLSLVACAHGVDDPLPAPPEPHPEKTAGPVQVVHPVVTCEITKTERVKDCTVYFFTCDDGNDYGAIECDTVPGAFVPEQIPEPYAER